MKQERVGHDLALGDRRCGAGRAGAVHRCVSEGGRVEFAVERRR